MGLPFHTGGQRGHLQLCKTCRFFPLVTTNQGLVQPARVKYNKCFKCHSLKSWKVSQKLKVQNWHKQKSDREEITFFWKTVLTSDDKLFRSWMGTSFLFQHSVLLRAWNGGGGEVQARDWKVTPRGSNLPEIINGFAMSSQPYWILISQCWQALLRGGQLSCQLPCVSTKGA